VIKAHKRLLFEIVFLTLDPTYQGSPVQDGLKTIFALQGRLRPSRDHFRYPPSAPKVRSRWHELTHAGKKHLMGSAGLTHKRMPCMAAGSVEVSETAILEWWLPQEEDANAGPSSVDQRLSDQMAREPSSLFPDPDGHNGYRGLCMTVASVEASKAACLECCPLHEEDAHAGPASVDR
jgi:hypothetical protein